MSNHIKEDTRLDEGIIQQALDSLREDQKMHDFVDWRTYATVIDGFSPLLTGSSLFQAAALTWWILQSYRDYASGQKDCDEHTDLDDVTTNLSAQMYCVNRTIGKDPMIGKDIYEREVQWRFFESQHQPKKSKELEPS